MKTLKISIAALIAVVSLSSCKKHYTCHCVVPPSVEYTVDGQYKNHNDAQTWCDNLGKKNNDDPSTCDLLN